MKDVVAMKCLSLKQPYAELLVAGKKTIEVRTRNTKYRGEFLVHASKKINEEACRRLKIDQAMLVTGAIIGNANLYDVKFMEAKIPLSRIKLYILQIQIMRNQNIVFW